MTDNPEYDATVRHSIYVERHKQKVAAEIVRMVSGLSDDLSKQIATSDLEDLTRRQLDRLLRDVRAAIKSGYEPITEAVETALKDFATYEAEWQSDMLGRVGIIADLGVPSESDLWAAVNARPFEGKFLKDWLDGLSENTIRRVQETIQQGYVDGLGSAEIARQIRGTRAQKYTDGIMATSRRGAEAMVRTAMSHTASMATKRTYQSRRGITHEYWVSVLDHRTSPACRSLSGKFFEKGEGPYPPQHIGCRSRRIAATKGNMAKLKEVETYQQWLRRQSKDVQDDILGLSRAALYREGGYSVDRFTDKSGQAYTLDQLRQKDADTFKDVFGE